MSSILETVLIAMGVSAVTAVIIYWICESIKRKIKEQRAYEAKIKAKYDWPP